MNAQAATTQPRKILIVDDDRIILKTLSLKLTASGYRIITAMDGSEAVSAARKEKPDLILLDITFPPDVAHGGGVPWDGFLIIQWLRRIDEAKDTPIILISGTDPTVYKDRVLPGGVVAYFRKPIDSEALLQSIRKTLGQPEPTPPAAESSEPKP